MSRFSPGQFGKVAVLMGGNSAEREISLLSGNAVFAALQRQGVNGVAIDMQDEAGFQQLQNGGFDRVLIMLHGRNGEDGKIQGALEFLGLSYTGSGVLASALAMDKVRTKLLWQRLGLDTPPFVQLGPESDWQQVINELGTAFVKPVKEGSSIGISKASNRAELEEAFHKANVYDDVVIAESFVDGPEFTVGILGDQVLPVVGMQAIGEFYDYNAKYLSDDTRYFCPCGLDAKTESQLAAMAKRAYDAVGCRGWGRVDAMCDSNGKFWLLEVNTVPGMTDHSLVPMAAKQAGIDFDELVLRILASSQVERGRE